MFILIGISPVVLVLVALAIVIGIGVSASTLLALAGIFAGGAVLSLLLVYLIARTQKAPPRNQLSRAEWLAEVGERAAVYHDGIWQHQPPPAVSEYHLHLDGLSERDRIEAASRYMATKYGSGEAYVTGEPYGSLPALTEGQPEPEFPEGEPR